MVAHGSETPIAALTVDGFLLVVAMPEETQREFERQSYPVTYTGLGKVNAAYALMRALAQLRLRNDKIRAVINFGTAGSSRFPTGSLIEITRFFQRDMDVRALGFALGETPFDPGPAFMTVPRRLAELPAGTCGTGDHFETRHPERFSAEAAPAYDVVDMEAYALAKICHLENLNFVSLKYISDGADDQAGADWAAQLPRAAAEFLKIYPVLARLTL